MSFMSRWIRTLCMTAFAAVTASTLLPALSLAAETTTLPAGAMALVNGQAIAQTTLDEAVRKVTSNAGAPDTPQLRAALKQDLIARELLRQQALRAHYDQRPEVAQAPAEQKTDAAIRAWIVDNVRAAAVTDADVKARYDAVIQTFGKDEYKPQVIAVADEATANTVIAAAKSGKPFADLAREYGVGATQANAGAMPWISLKLPLTEGNTHGVPMPLAQAITSLAPGELLPQPLKADDGWLIVRLEAKRAMAIPKFDASKEEIRRTLQAEAMDLAMAQRVTQLAQEATIVE
ncbi:peptidylprolyl isomerase [Paraburkholderia acidisoli]|uniref:peptidylprolyl isomerase n=1 Tax=Paraburkholderia acidisoli TaxID=2571748 RepID=A0A7Z2JHT5_9BURK|nr:peptidyl-prolyl cis-trans isomerase [Paraburkholderia acidisoli]QGZ63714.1 peptidyl-prolyl cis-trans isomerase [Paraburkholderia acidisoli]